MEVGKLKNVAVFFDINGTIIKRDSRTDIPFAEAVDEFLNIEDGMEGVDTSARSDKDVFMEVLENNKKEFSEELWNDFLKVYESKLEKFKDTDVWRLNEDADEYIKKLYYEGYTLCLISGELSIGAKYKLEKLGLWKYFITGGFGEDGLKRFEIADSALKKAKEERNTEFAEMYVIGDTVLDIKTARHLGAKVISITTGSHSREKLEKENPDWIIDKFSDIDFEL
jgi:phosphoglycolate phosphatase-like HAD superfamily hydrolase